MPDIRRQALFEPAIWKEVAALEDRADDIEPRADLAMRLPRDVPLFFHHGSNDEIVPSAHVELYAHLLPRAQVRRLARRDHQLDNRLAEIATDIRRLA